MKKLGKIAIAAVMTLGSVGLLAGASANAQTHAATTKLSPPISGTPAGMQTVNLPSTGTGSDNGTTGKSGVTPETQSGSFDGFSCYVNVAFFWDTNPYWSAGQYTYYEFGYGPGLLEDYSEGAGPHEMFDMCIVGHALNGQDLWALYAINAGNPGGNWVNGASGPYGIAEPGASGPGPHETFLVSCMAQFLGGQYVSEGMSWQYTGYNPGYVGLDVNAPYYVFGNDSISNTAGIGIYEGDPLCSDAPGTP